MDSPPSSSNRLSLEEMCVRSAIDNLEFIGDVGHTDTRLLRIILPHCTADQLLHIEESTKGRDLSQITNELWQKCYKRKFGEENMQTVLKRMKDTKKFFKWKALYQAKVTEQAEVEKKCVNRLRELYKVAGDQKASRQLQQIDVFPPAGKKRTLGAGVGSSSLRFGKSASKSSDARGRLMKKSRQDYAASHDAKRIAALRRKPSVPGKVTSSVGRR